MSGPQGLATDIIRGLVSEVVTSAVAQRPASERNRISATEIRVVLGSPFPGPRAGIDNGQRLVVIPQNYVWHLLGYVEAEVYGSISDQPHFAEWWTDYWLWRLPTPIFPSFGRLYQGAPPKMPLEFAGFSDQEAQQFRAANQVLITGEVNAALLDILLHELGHHALDEWYFPGETPPSQARTIEAAADVWATEVFESMATAYPALGILDRRNAMGRLFSVSQLHALHRFGSTAQIDPGTTHPAHSSRLAAAFSDDYCTSITNEVAEFCDWIYDRIEVLSDSSNLEVDYQTRAASGEGFADYRLGMIAFSRNDMDAGCAHVLEAAGRTDRRVWQYAGWCVEFGHSSQGSNPQDARQLAISFYRIAQNAGFSDATMGLVRLGAAP